MRSLMKPYSAKTAKIVRLRTYVDIIYHNCIEITSIMVYTTLRRTVLERLEMDIIQILSKEFNLNYKIVEDTVALIDEGNTIPFIARYRKEITGSMDDQVLRKLSDRLSYLRNLQARKEEVENSISEQGKMTDEISKALFSATTLAAVEDIYRPYKQKRKTRASIAKARGLEPLALRILEQSTGDDPFVLAADYIDEEKEVSDIEAALAGARDIIAEIFSDDANNRNSLRNHYQRNARVTSKASKDEDSVYSSYYEYSEPFNKMVGHRILALDRGEKEGFLKVAVDVDTLEATQIIIDRFVKKGQCLSSEQVKMAAQDSFARLIHPSLERELRSGLTEMASEGAIKVFGQNLRQLLLQPPVRGKVAMGLDPGYRMGCKVAVVDEIGLVLDTAVIYPIDQFGKVAAAERKVTELIKKHAVKIIAIGNGTAGRETELFTAKVLKQLSLENIMVEYTVVNEAGASVYSASELAAEEFPQFDVNLRSAVSIARRLQDPLAELVKIDPKAVGVGQYQHDMPPQRLAGTLNGVVEDCVNTVGVELNTASAPLLERVAGLGVLTAKNIVKLREEKGAFSNRKELLKVPKLGPKAYQQCAGFLRLNDGNNPLDKTAVHPESYSAAEELLSVCGYKVSDIGTPSITQLPEKAKSIGHDELAKLLKVGKPTLVDILDELLRPGRDIRDSLPPPILRTDVLGVEDLLPGMELTGTVRNVVDFGAFVDIGVHQDGLVHISRIASRFIKHPSEELSVGDVITVWVLEVDKKKGRISLTMLTPNK